MGVHGCSVTLDSLWPYGIASQVPCPWDCPGKNIGLACHFLIQGIFQTQGSTCVSYIDRHILYHWATWEIQFQMRFQMFYKLWSVSSVQSLSCVWLFATPWIAAHQASLSITNSQSLLKLMPIELVMPSSHLILCRPLLLLPPIPPSIRVFSNESTLHIRWPKYWSFSFSISPFNEYPGLIPLGKTGWISLQSKGLWRVFVNTTVQKHQFFGTQFSSQSNSHIHTWPLEKP